ncbi:hypothetical protein E1B28_006107 [Marasmius oreades]|uniref:Uncharacterized protein n=1 Tax=Marasmius oreades TaxID=181124 RepID=A0A9P7S671_9AGAR|nr:uncharacterized protein E1B28_006107 [Marasmius oreades]KAG7095346.1 hypothetical protein E1B28_006107 [Marasmius oreades]
MASGKGLLFVYGDHGGGVTEDDFNAWYDNEHAPARLTVPGILTAVRYKAIDHKSPKWLALYDMTGPSVLQTDEYRSLRTNASQNERNIISRLSLLNRQIFTLISLISSSSTSQTAYGKFLYVVHMNVITTKESEVDHEAEFINWYSATRIELLRRVPGWIRSRVFKIEGHLELAGMVDKVSPLVKKPPTKFIALHEWDTEGIEVIGSTKFKECMTAEQPWTTEIQKAYAEMEDRRFALYKTFDQ